MTDADKTGFFTAVTSTLDIAIHISPLAMLARLPGSRFHIRRDVFFEVGVLAWHCCRQNRSNIFSGAKPSDQNQRS